MNELGRKKNRCGEKENSVGLLRGGILRGFESKRVPDFGFRIPSEQGSTFTKQGPVLGVTGQGLIPRPHRPVLSGNRNGFNSWFRV